MLPLSNFTIFIYSRKYQIYTEYLKRVDLWNGMLLLYQFRGKINPELFLICQDSLTQILRHIFLLFSAPVGWNIFFFKSHSNLFLSPLPADFLKDIHLAIVLWHFVIISIWRKRNKIQVLPSMKLQQWWCFHYCFHWQQQHKILTIRYSPGSVFLIRISKNILLSHRILF